MAQYEGVIEITKIRNSGLAADQIGTLTARFVRYPGSQQLSVWLPEKGWDYGGKARILHLNTQQLLEEKPVADLLNGSVLLLWDTRRWPPGEYRLEVEHPQRGMHELSFKKWDEGVLVPKGTLVEMPVATAQSPSRIVPAQTDSILSAYDTDRKVYQDGSGQEMPDEDQILRNDMNKTIRKLFEKLTGKSGPHLEYEGNFRGGNLIYVEGAMRLSFWHEMGGGDCQMYIDVPDENTWEQRTGTPLNRRAEILHFVASTVKREKASSWRYEIHEREIAFY
jgi:hypothetical protein